jgi:hypothetical protein
MFHLLIITGALAMIVGCAPDYTTSITVIDPSRVSVSKRLNNESLEMVLPSSKDSAAAVIYSSVPLSDSVSQAVLSNIVVMNSNAFHIVSVIRSRSATISLVSNQYVQDKIIMGEGGSIEIFDRNPKEFVSRNSKAKKSLEVDYIYPLSYNSNAHITPVAVIPWDNVKSIRGTKEQNRTGGWLWLMMGGLSAFWGGVGALSTNNYAGFYLKGLMIPGIMMGGLGVFYLTWPEKKMNVYP